jgi:predicted nucleic acid-binding protein
MVFGCVVVDASDYEEAAKAGNRCKAKGVAVSIVDILLCAVAIQRQWAVFTTDPDFSGCATVLPLRIHTR